MYPLSLAGCAVLLLSLFTIDSFAQTQFQNATKIAAAKGYNITPLLGDYDGDGDMDILGTGSYVQNSTSTNATVLFRNDGAAGFVIVTTQLPWFYYGGMYQWADLDNDNDLDIIGGGCSSYCYNTKTLKIFRNDGADNFTLITTPTNLIGGKLFTFTDYNNDGLIDIEIATQSDNNDSVVGHTFYINTGNFVFQKTFEVPATGGEVAWGDLDNDGWKDFVLLNRAYRNLKNGAFEPFSPTITMQTNVRHFIFDGDHDGDLDVITSNGILMVNDGFGQLSFGPILIPYQYINSLLISDFDGDGDKDIAASGGTSTTSKTQLFRSNGDMTFTAENLHEQYTYSYQLAEADIDQDNDPDILLSGVFTSDIVILENGLTTGLSNPAAPANLQTSINAGVITFSWDEATDPEQPSASLTYNLYLTNGEKFQIAPNADLSTGESFTPGAANAWSARHLQLSVSNLPEGYYQWSVQSVDDELNTSEFAAPQEFTLYKNNPANAPSDLTTTAVADRSVSLSWMDNSNDETAFTVERSLVNGNSGFQAIEQLASNTLSFTDNSVSPRSVYYYRIRMDGPATAYSNVIRIETESAIGIAPTNATATALNSASTKLEWEYLGTGITGFVIERSHNDKYHFAAIGSVGAEQHTYSDQQLESGSTYYYRLFAVNGEDFSEYSNIMSVSVPLKEFIKTALPSLSYENFVSGGVAWGDYDNDGYDDVFFAHKAQLFHNKGDGTFEKIASTGITTSAGATDWVAVWGDYDNDRFLDLFYYNNSDKGWIYRGDGYGTFIRITTAISSDLSTISNASWTDFDMDGDLDLSTGDRYVYRYDGNDIFVRVNFPGNSAGYYNTSVASWADFDDDGDPDVFLGNYGHDEFFRNKGDGSFTAITDQRVTKDYNFDCCPIATPIALWADFNNDRKLDLTTFHGGGPIYAYANHANKLDSVFYSYEYNRASARSSFWNDYDNDGDLDLFTMGQYDLRTSIWENKEGHPFRQLKGGPLYFFSSSDMFSWNDFDNDGFSDLFELYGNTIHKNIPNGNSWIKIRLRGHASNSTGLGAKVFVKSNSRWQRSDVTTHHSNRVQQGFMSVFGLGNATKVDSVKIIWPSGNRQYLTNLNVNQVILIDEGNAQEVMSQAPSNLIAEINFPSSVTLKWTDRSNDETGFVIEMATEDGQFTQAGTVGPNINFFKVNGLVTGVKYKFRVRTSTNNTRWTNTAEVQIRLFTEVFGADLTAFQSNPEGLAWGDPDNDGDPDLFVGSQSFEPDAVYYNDKGLFTRKLIRNTSNYSRQAQWIDYNNDGYQDLHISVGGGIGAVAETLNDFLYKNDGAGQLVQQTGNSLVTDGYPDFTAAWGDLNKDGYLDMITPRSGEKSSVFLNLGGNMTAQPGYSGFSFQSGRLVFLSDLDNDDDLDLIITSSFNQVSVFENVNGQFSPITNSGLSLGLSSVVLEDFDNDGAQDIMAVNDDQKLSLFLFDPVSKTFTDRSDAFATFGSIVKLSAGDFDNNGYVDLFVIGQVNFTSNTNRIFLNHGNLKFTSLIDPILERSLGGMASADINKDGHLDLVTTAIESFSGGKRYILQGTTNENHWLRIRLKGTALNKFGIGARIRLFTGSTSQVRDIRSGSGGTFTDEQIAHFGLGSISLVDYIKVEWPSGEDQWIANPSLDTEMIIEKQNTSGPPAPAKPTGLDATYRFGGYIDLSWSDNSDNEKFYRIERAIGTGPFKFFKKVTSNTISYTDSTFTDYEEYRLDLTYRVVAVSYVESDPSNEAPVSVITGIEDYANNGLAIFPQPASSRVFIRNEHRMHNIEVIGARGEIISEVAVAGSREVELPLAGFTPGIYFLRITDDQRTIGKKLIVTGR